MSLAGDFSWPNPDLVLTSYTTKTNHINYCPASPLPSPKSSPLSMLAGIFRFLHLAQSNEGSDCSKYQQPGPYPTSLKVTQEWNWMPLVHTANGWTDTKNASQVVMSVASPRYNSTSCTTTWIYVGSTNTGTITSQCSDGTGSTETVHYPPTINRDKIVGSATITVNNPDKSKTTFSISENGRTSLILQGSNAYTYTMALFVSARKRKLVDTEGRFTDLGLVPCTYITAGGSPATSVGKDAWGNDVCQVIVSGRGQSRVDVTPTASAPYYVYGVDFNSGYPIRATPIEPPSTTSY